MPTEIHLKEEFVSGHSGTSWLEVVLITCVFPCGRLLYAVGGTLLLPTLLSCWSSQTGQVAVAIIITSIALAGIFQWVRGSSSPISDGHQPTVTWIQAATALHAHPKSYISVFRAGLTAYTCIAILAVDFTYFPRRLAKAETFGTGLMDLGPGLYVFSFGLMLGLRIQRSRQRASPSSVRPLAKAAHTFQATKGADHSNGPVSLLLRAACSVGPLAALGAARLVLTKAVEYQEHQSEYGVHWNFFFTLATVACLAALMPLSGTKASSVSLLVMVLYQVLLLQPGWTEWLASDERDHASLFDSNKEGLMSLFGYTAICNAGAATAAIVHEDSVVVIKVREIFIQLLPLANAQAQVAPAQAAAWHVVLFGVAGASWLLAIICDAFVQPVSRRFANAAYVLWVVALAVMQLGLSALAEMGAAVINGRLAPAPCGLVDSLSKHQLSAFLIANVATGAVNLSVDTLRASDSFAFSILVAYCVSWGYVGCWLQMISSAWSHGVQRSPKKVKNLVD